jgi:hypothetical protein
MIKTFSIENQLFKYSIPLGLLLFCSLFYQEQQFFVRNSHALSTKYNILYNGQIGLD